MKNLVLTIGCAVAVAGSALAQGTVNWSTIGGNFIAQTNSTTYSTLVGSTPGQATGSGAVGATTSGGTGNIFYYQLLFLAGGAQVSAPTSLAGLNSFTALAGATGTNGVSNNGRIVQQNPNTGFGTPAAWSAGVSNSFVLVGWSANLGTTYATALNALNTWATSYVVNAFFGISSTGYIAAGASNPGPTLFNASPNASGNPINNGVGSPAQLLLLAPVPEPGTMALAGLGGLAMLALRRKK